MFPSFTGSDFTEVKWEESFKALIAYKAEFGDCLVPLRFTYQGLNLGRWVFTQRRTKEILSAERIKRLDDLGFVWVPHAQQWEKNYNALVAYKAEFGDCLVPQGLTYQGTKLGSCVGTQRKTKEKLSSERIQRIDDLGFVWRVR